MGAPRWRWRLARGAFGRPPERPKLAQTATSGNLSSCGSPAATSAGHQSQLSEARDCLDAAGPRGREPASLPTIGPSLSGEPPARRSGGAQMRPQRPAPVQGAAGWLVNKRTEKMQMLAQRFARLSGSRIGAGRRALDLFVIVPEFKKSNFSSAHTHKGIPQSM